MKFYSTSVYSRELKYGIPVTDENGNKLGESANAAKQAIVQVVVSRIGMAVPAMGNVNIIITLFYDGSASNGNMKDVVLLFPE